MKKFLVFGILVLALGFASQSLAQTSYPAMGMMGNIQNNAQTQAQLAQDPAISAALQDIYKSQNVSSQSQVDCSKVTDSQFEKLGDAYMGYGITEQQHTAMENMMGGEGSATVATAHINMGRAFLGCWAGYKSGPVYMPMMAGFGYNGTTGYGMMGYGNQGFGGIMHSWDGSHTIFGWVVMIAVFGLVILGIVALIKFIQKDK